MSVYYLKHYNMYWRAPFTWVTDRDRASWLTLELAMDFIIGSPEGTDIVRVDDSGLETVIKTTVERE